MAKLVEYNAIISDEEIKKAIARAHVERSAFAVRCVKSVLKFFKAKPAPVVTPSGFTSAV
ncbi:MAG: hypothetical protein R3261_03965 [Alphaproteobacteria bacterium]|nr:hypothetical protein [Alphaproteobacteria bacterium]